MKEYGLSRDDFDSICELGWNDNSNNNNNNNTNATKNTINIKTEVKRSFTLQSKAMLPNYALMTAAKKMAKVDISNINVKDDIVDDEKDNEQDDEEAGEEADNERDVIKEDNLIKVKTKNPKKN